MTSREERIAESSRTIFSYCRARTNSREDAEDLTQDILCELLRSADSLRDENAFYGFMWGVAGNVYRQWLKKKSRTETAELPEEIPAPECEPEGEEQIRLLRRELALLSEKYRRASVLYYIDGLSCSAIAEKLSVSESTVKYLLFKSRKILKEGMTMERTNGTLSYNPKTLIPLYSGAGPNRFDGFMQSLIRQNILAACWSDNLTAQQISLETGIPLPYLDDDIRAMTEKQILLRDGPRYQANVIVLTTECSEEIDRAAAPLHREMADRMEQFLTEHTEAYKSLGFAGCDFSENTLRWQLLTILMRRIAGVDCGRNAEEKAIPPVTGWGERAHLWCAERLHPQHCFRYCGVGGKAGESLYFFDYLRGGKGDHHDFYGNDRKIRLYLDICRGDGISESEYDRESAAEMIRQGYVTRKGERLRTAAVVYTDAQYKAVHEMARVFLQNGTADTIRQLHRTAAEILRAHTPAHLQAQVPAIAAMDSFVHTVCIPAEILIDRGVLSTDWHPAELPTTYAVMG